MITDTAEDIPSDAIPSDSVSDDSSTAEATPQPTPSAAPAPIVETPTAKPPRDDTAMDQFLASSSVSTPDPKADDSMTGFLHETAPELARKAIDEYKAGKTDFDVDQVKVLSRIARDGVGPWESLIRGSKNLWDHRGLVFSKVLPEMAHGAVKAVTETKPMTPGQFSLATNMGVAKGLLDLPVFLGGATSELGELITEPIAKMLGYDPTNMYASMDAGAFNAEHLLNKGTKAVGEATNVDTESTPFQAAELIGPAAVPLGGEAALGKAADAATNLATRAAGKTIQGAAKVGRAVAPAAAAALEVKHGGMFGLISALGTLAAGYGPEDAPIFGRIRTAVIDKAFNKVDDVGRLLANTENGSSVLGTLRDDLGKEAQRYSEQLKTLSEKAPDAVKDATRTLEDGTPVFKADELAGDARRAREIQDMISQLTNKRDRLLKWQDTSHVITSAARDLSLAGILGAGMTGATAAPGDQEAPLRGAGFGVFAGALGLPLTFRSHLMEVARRNLIRAGEEDSAAHPHAGLHDEALDDLSDEHADHIHTFGGIAAGNGGHVIVARPDRMVDLLKERGENVATAPDGFHDPKTNTAYLNSEALRTGVAGHEVTHALTQAMGWLDDPAYGRALDNMLSSTDPKIKETLQQALDNYHSRLRVNSPDAADLTPKQLKEEVTAALGVDLFTARPPESIYGGRTNLQAVGDWIRHRFAPIGPSKTAQFGFPVTPEMRKSLGDLLFKAGKQADAIKDIDTNPDAARKIYDGLGNVAPAGSDTEAEPTPNIDPHIRRNAIDAVRSMHAVNETKATQLVDDAIASATKSGEEPSMNYILRVARPGSNIVEASAPTTPRLSDILWDKLQRGDTNGPDGNPDATLVKAQGAIQSGEIKDAGTFQKWLASNVDSKLGLQPSIGTDKPNSSTDRLVSPALMTKDGMILKGDSHDALVKAADKMGIDVTDARTGFTTKSGKFLEQGRYSDDALNWGHETGQIPAEMDHLTDHIFNSLNKPNLQPTLRDEALSYADESSKKPYVTEDENILNNPAIHHITQRTALMGFDGIDIKHPDGTVTHVHVNRDMAVDYQPSIEMKALQDLKKRWSDTNNKLLPYVRNPNAPEAMKLYDQLRDISKEITHLRPLIPAPENAKGARQVVIIGGGPGGLSTAIMGAADGLDTLVLEAAPQTGGQARFSSRIENYPGFAIGATGRDLLRQFYNQATRLGSEVRTGVRVTGIDYDPHSGIKTVKLSNGETINAHSVVLAGGIKWRHLNFPGSDSPSVMYGNGEMVGVTAANKPAVIIGGSNGAAQAALGAARKASHVTLVSRSPITKGMSDYQVEAVKSNPKITVIEGDEIAKLNTDDKGVATSVVTKGGKEIPASAVGVFAGGVPNTDWMPPSIRRTARGTIAVDDDLQTSLPGVFAIGDIQEHGMGRIGAAVGDGQRASKSVFNYLDSLQHKPDTTTDAKATTGQGTGDVREGLQQPDRPDVPVRQGPSGGTERVPSGAGAGVAFQPKLSPEEQQLKFDKGLERYHMIPPVFKRAISKTVADPEFKKWFGDSKIVDDDGNPKVLFHQTPAANNAGIFERGFDPSIVTARSTDEFVPDGVFMKTTPDIIRGIGNSMDSPSEHPLFAKIENPLTVQSREAMRQWGMDHNEEYSKYATEADKMKRQFLDDMHQFESNYVDAGFRNDRAAADAAVNEGNERHRKFIDEDAPPVSAKARAALTQALKDEGYDGVIIGHDVGGPDNNDLSTHIVFDPKQIKSAILNRGTFDPNDPRIQYQPSDHPDAIDLAAIRLPDGHIYAAANHALAEDYAREENVPESEIAGAENGWLDKKEQFLDRTEAAARAVKIGQMPVNAMQRIPAYDDASGVMTEKPVLGHTQFGRYRNFQPSTDEEVNLAIAPGISRGFNKAGAFTPVQLSQLTDDVLSRVAPKGSFTALSDAGIENHIERTTGQFQGNTEPSLVLRLPHSDFDTARHVAAILGDSLLQDAVIPVEHTPDGSQFGLQLKPDGNKLTPQQIDAFSKFAKDKGLDYTVWNDGSRIVLYDSKMFGNEHYDASDFSSFADKLKPIVDKLQLTPEHFRQNSEYVSHENYQDIIGHGDPRSEEGRPDLFEGAKRSLYAPAWEAFQKFYRDTGFKPKGDPPSGLSLQPSSDENSDLYVAPVKTKPVSVAAAGSRGAEAGQSIIDVSIGEAPPGEEQSSAYSTIARGIKKYVAPALGIGQD